MVLSTFLPIWTSIQTGKRMKNSKVKKFNGKGNLLCCTAVDSQNNEYAKGSERAFKGIHKESNALEKKAFVDYLIHDIIMINRCRGYGPQLHAVDLHPQKYQENSLDEPVSDLLKKTVSIDAVV
ncbi:hypothetical protein M513_13482 [Trichuris suis]|uniref:Uncharacterized protein n=1 Tax=Trichuris suis TaxID=68888 RepID=A0A085LKY9_9BILA|nr:hypothetical protein M513_13482 [Trichuris suis]